MSNGNDLKDGSILTEMFGNHRSNQHPKTKNRTRLEIVSQMLELAKQKSLKTRLSYGSNLSSRGVNKYLRILLDQGLIVEISKRGNSHRAYEVSSRGLDFLRNYHEMKSFTGRE